MMTLYIELHTLIGSMVLCTQRAMQGYKVCDVQEELLIL